LWVTPRHSLTTHAQSTSFLPTFLGKINLNGYLPTSPQKDVGKGINGDDDDDDDDDVVVIIGVERRL